MTRFNFGPIKRRILALTTAIAVGFTGAAIAQTTEFSQDDLIWAYVQQVGSPDAYAAYLAENPNGKFANEARTTLLELADRGIFPARNVAGLQFTGNAQNLSQLVGVGADQDLAGFFLISYAG